MKFSPAMVLFIIILPCMASADPLYQETLAGLKKVYIKETIAHRNYTVFSKKARAEGYGNISRLFAAIAFSEAIHARNIKAVISEIGGEVKEPPIEHPLLSDTKDNLGTALERELADIDHTYPDVMEKIKAEGCEKAVSVIRYALESEKQHKTIIESIIASTRSDTMFGIVSGIIESKESKCFICNLCGSTLLEAPSEKCPVCGGPESNYSQGP